MPKLQQSTDYASLFRDLPGKYILFAADAPDFTILDENFAHAEVAMTKRSDSIGKPLLEAFPDTSDKFKETGVSDLIESLKKVVASKQPDEMSAIKYDLIDKKGIAYERWWQATHYPIFDNDGSVRAILQRTEDITARVISDIRLAEVQRRLDDAVNIGQLGTWAWDVEKNTVIANRNLAEMFGVSAEAAAEGLPIDTFTDAIYSEDRDRVLKKINTTLQRKEKFDVEYRTLSTDGTVRWVIARGNVIVDDTGNIVSFPGMILDITEQKQAQRNLLFLANVSTELTGYLDQEKMLRNIATMTVEDIADYCSISIMDDEEDVLREVALEHRNRDKRTIAKEYHHSQARQITSDYGLGKVIATGEAEFYPDVTPEQMKQFSSGNDGMKLARELDVCSVIIVPLTTRSKTVGAITIISTEQKYHYTERDFEMASDLARRVSLAMTNASLFEQTAHELAQKERLQIQLSAANEALETRVKRRTIELQETNLRLERSNQELQDFAYVASHDLQEPLRKIQAFGTILDEEFADVLGEGRDYLDRMRKAAARMSTLIEDLLAFSRVTTHAKELQQIDLNLVVSEVLEDLETRISDTKGKVIVGHLPKLAADPMQMRQLFQNLIGNALKFHRPDVPSVVKISSKIDKSGIHARKCVITIADNGVGFDEKYLDRIFAVFQRLHGRDDYEGTGIGLAVCRKIVDRHKGKITATSAQGKGSTFIITLPLVQAKQGASHDNK